MRSKRISVWCGCERPCWKHWSFRTYRYTTIYFYKNKDCCCFGKYYSPNSPACKYLGICLDSRLNFKQYSIDMEERENTRAKYFRSYAMMASASQLHTTKIYQTICWLVLEYGFPICSSSRVSTTTKNIKTADRQCLRIISTMRHPQNSLYRVFFKA